MPGSCRQLSKRCKTLGFRGGQSLSGSFRRECLFFSAALSGTFSSSLSGSLRTLSGSVSGQNLSAVLLPHSCPLSARAKHMFPAQTPVTCSTCKNVYLNPSPVLACSHESHSIACVRVCNCPVISAIDVVSGCFKNPNGREFQERVHVGQVKRACPKKSCCRHPSG